MDCQTMVIIIFKKTGNKLTGRQKNRPPSQEGNTGIFKIDNIKLSKYQNIKYLSLIEFQHWHKFHDFIGSHSKMINILIKTKKWTIDERDINRKKDIQICLYTEFAEILKKLPCISLNTDNHSFSHMHNASVINIIKNANRRLTLLWYFSDFKVDPAKSLL